VLAEWLLRIINEKFKTQHFLNPALRYQVSISGLRNWLQICFSDTCGKLEGANVLRHVISTDGELCSVMYGACLSASCPPPAAHGSALDTIPYGVRCPAPERDWVRPVNRCLSSRSQRACVASAAWYKTPGESSSFPNSWNICMRDDGPAIIKSRTKFDYKSAILSHRPFDLYANPEHHDI